MKTSQTVACQSRGYCRRLLMNFERSSSWQRCVSDTLSHPLAWGCCVTSSPHQASLKPRDSSVFVQEHYAVIGIGNCLWCFCLPPNCRSGVEIPIMISIKWSSRYVVVFYIFSQSTIVSPPLWVWSNLRTMYIICHGLQRSHPRCVIGSSVSKVPCSPLPQNYYSSHITEDWIKFWVGKSA